MDRTTKNYVWTVVAALWVVSMLNYLDRLLITSMRDPIKESIPMTDAQFGLLTSVFLLVYGILSPFGGYFADRYSRKIVIIISLMVWSGVTLWTGFVTTYAEMLTARSLMGISEACFIPAAVAMVMDYHKGPTRSLASGILMSGLYAGMAMGGAGGYIAEYWGWRFGFQIFGLIGIAYAIVLIFVLKDSPEAATVNVKEDNDRVERVPEIIRNLFSSRSYWIIILYGTLLGMTFWVIYAWLPTYFKDGFKLTLGEAGISATAFIQFASFIGVISGGILADRLSRKYVKGRVLVPAIGFIIGGPFLFLMASTGVFWIAITSIIIFGLAKGFHDANFMPVICQVVDPRYQATGYGMMSFFSVIAGGIMIYLGGALKDAGISLSLVFQISAVGVFIAGLMLFFIRPKNVRKDLNIN
jgi:predicted MFS family arabinose efflux permease